MIDSIIYVQIGFQFAFISSHLSLLIVIDTYLAYYKAAVVFSYIEILYLTDLYFLSADTMIKIVYLLKHDHELATFYKIL